MPWITFFQLIIGALVFTVLSAFFRTWMSHARNREMETQYAGEGHVHGQEGAEAVNVCKASIEANRVAALEQAWVTFFEENACDVSELDDAGYTRYVNRMKSMRAILENMYPELQPETAV